MGVRFAARNHPTAVRFVARNHPSVCVADSSPQRGAKHDLRQDIGSPGGELDAKRPEGWFLIACIKNHGINPAQYCRLKCIKAAKREPSHGYYDEVPILLFLFRVFRRGLFAKRPENPS